MQLIFVLLHESVPTEAYFQHELFFLTPDGSMHQRVGLFGESAIIDTVVFEKKFQFKSLASTSGTYILKTDVQIGSDTYTQSVLFNISPKELVTIGGSTTNQTNISRVILWNILFVLLLFGFMLTIAASEYRRFSVSEPIDEETLRAKGYF